MKRPIYLDYQATTPLAPEARAAMMPLVGGGVSATRTRRIAWAARRSAAVEVSREMIAAPFGPGGRLLFTGGATEALNWAIKGIAELAGHDASAHRRHRDRTCGGARYGALAGAGAATRSSCCP